MARMRTAGRGLHVGRLGGRFGEVVIGTQRRRDPSRKAAT